MTKKTITSVLRVVLALTFIFSGFVKGIDPLGSAYKFTDYFNAFNAEWAVGLSLFLSFFLSAAEFFVGVALLLKFQLKLASLGALLFMCVFTPLTFYLALTNPVTDCGCFGDAVKLSNWNTFYKNIFFFIAAIITFQSARKAKKSFSLCRYKIAGFLVIAIAYTASVVYSHRHLPIFDFRPYHVGVNIPEAMNVPEDAPIDVYETEFVYENKNSGEHKAFTESNYPWQDTVNWTYVSAESVLVQEGYKAPIHDFTMETPDGDDVSDYFLYEERYTFLMVAYRLDKFNDKSVDQLLEVQSFAHDSELNMIGLSASAPDEIENLKNEYGFDFEFFSCDEVTLKTIVRSNPGLLLLQNGTIVEKWAWRDIPNYEELQEKYGNQ